MEGESKGFLSQPAFSALLYLPLSFFLNACSGFVPPVDKELPSCLASDV